MHLTMIQQQQTIVSTNDNQQQQQTKMQPTKITKARRTRQPRNPQLSVARRNERERNRVKMVNNGFALLREHLPIEDLQAFEQPGGSETPDGTSSGGKSAGQKAKKFSKVETLRAAIQRIKMLEELIRSTEPGFESINITSTGNSQHLNMYDEEPLSVCGGEALSYMSSSSPHSSSTTTTATAASTQQAFNSSSSNNNNINLDNNNLHLTAYQQQYQPEHFIKLEPQQTTPQFSPQQLYNVPSPQNSQHSHSSGPKSNQQPQYQQVHHHNQQQQLEAMQQPTMSPAEPLQEEPSHTHLWIQQHQSSFIEQQQQQYQQQQQQQQQMNQPNWYTQQQPQQVDQNNTNSIQVSQTSPVWFTNSPNGSSGVVSVGQVSAQTQPTISRFNHQNQHQISLYSQ